MRPSVAIALLTAAGCALPDRDNPYDPRNRPTASLTVSPPVGGPATPFTFDASGSSGDGPMRYEFDLDGDGVFELDNGPEPVAARAYTLPPTAFPASGIGAITRRPRVRVRARGATAVADAEVTIENHAPVIDVGPTRTVPAWTGGAITLDVCAQSADCRSFDPDGPEGVRWTWRQVPEPTVSLAVDSTQGTAVFTAPEEPQILFFEARGSDGFASVSQVLRVKVGGAVWVTTVEPTRTLQIHTDAASFPIFAYLEAIGAGPDGQVWLGLTDAPPSSSPRRIERRNADGMVESSWSIPAGMRTEEIVPARSSAGAACARLTDIGISRVAVLDPGPGSGAAQVVGSIADARFVLPDRGDPESCLVVGDAQVRRVGMTTGAVTFLGAAPILAASATTANDGAVWVADSYVDPDLHRIGLDGTSEVIAVAVPGEVLALFPAPENGVTVLAYDEVLRLHAWQVTDVVRELGVPALPIDPFQELAPAGVDAGLWIVSPGEGVLRRLDHAGDAFHTGFELRPEELGIADGTFFEPVSDPFGGGLVVAAFSEADGTVIRRLPYEGRLTTEVPPPYVFGADVELDPGGGHVWTTAYSGSAFRIDSTGRIDARVVVPGAAFDALRARPDGGLVVSELLSGGSVVRRYSVNGAFESELAVPAATRLVGLALDGAGEVACAVGQDNLTSQRRLLRGDASQLVDASPAVDQANPDPLLASDGACWMAERTGAGLGRWHRQAAGGMTSHDATIDVVAAVADLTDGGIWYTDGVTMVHMDAAGNEDPGWLLPAAASAGAVRIGIERRCSDVLQPGCRALWVLGASDVFRLDVEGGVETKFSVPGSPKGLALVPQR